MDYIDPNEIAMISTATNTSDVKGHYGYILFKSGVKLPVDSIEYEYALEALRQSELVNSEDYAEELGIGL